MSTGCFISKINIYVFTAVAMYNFIAGNNKQRNRFESDNDKSGDANQLVLRDNSVFYRK